jgi:hypothetical protein
MDLVDLALLYGVVGAGCAVVALACRRPVDALLLLPLWPLYGPFALTRSPAPPASPLRVLLPEPSMIEALERRVAEGGRRVAEIAATLDRPEFSERDAAARVAELEAGAPSAAHARSRLDNIRRLAALRRSFELELEEASELLAQLTTQAEVVRLVGAQPGTRELVTDIAARVEGLDHMLAEELEESMIPPRNDPPPPGR